MIQITIDNSTDARSLRIMADMLQAMADARETKSADATAGHPRQWPDLINNAPTVSTAAAGGPRAVHEVESCPSHDVADFDGDTGLEVDINGVPWDERIHSSNRAKNADGTWRRRRGIDDELFNAVVAELRGEVAPEKAPKSTPPSLFDTPPPSTPDAPVAAESIFAPPPPPAPAAIAPPTAAAAVRPVNFADLVAAIVAQGVAADKVTAACTAEGVANLAVLGAQPDKVAAVAARLGL